MGDKRASTFSNDRSTQSNPCFIIGGRIMTNALRVMMLLTDGFGGVGGIAKFNRDFLGALDGCAEVERVHALPRLIPEPIDELIPEAVVYDRKSAGGKLAFMVRLFLRACRG